MVVAAGGVLCLPPESAHRYEKIMLLNVALEAVNKATLYKSGF